MARLACKTMPDEEVDRRIAALPERFAEIGREVHQRAPSDATRGHDVCSADPWVFGFTFEEQPSGIQKMPYHPTEAAMRAIAAAIDGAL